jgi:3-hydroxyisobutyrate dehydrogenase
MLPSSPQVKEVYNGSIIPTLQKLHTDPSQETFCIDATTLDVDIARSVASNVIKTGARMVDAPVSGGTKFVGGLKMTYYISPSVRRCDGS